MISGVHCHGGLRKALLPVGLLLIAACREEPIVPTDFNPDWTTASHSGNAKPNYALVYPQDSVNRMDIIMTTATWNAIRQDMIKVWGFDFGKPNRPCCGQYPPENATYEDVTVKFNGKIWKHVGFRPKGNLTLQTAWSAGNYKFPFRLKFDAFETTYEETWNQRLYGFKDFSAAAPVTDGSAIRDRLAYDQFRAEGVAAPRSASYRVFIDFGQGLTYNGVYTFNELPEDTMIRDQFGDASGNIYKPESALHSFAEAEFPRQDNKTSTDFSDVQTFIKALNDTALQRTNRAQWRANLEATFNVDNYLKFLAVNNAIVGWDGYGFIAHNYYLYNDPKKHLTWIPWDQDFDFNDEPDVVGVLPRTTRAFSLTMNEIDNYWALVRYTMDDSVYFKSYKGYLRAFNNNVFTQERLNAAIDKYSRQIAPFMIGPLGEIADHTWGYDPDQADFLKSYVARRRATIDLFAK
ncbi:MAG TPA: CotH kinase family protein [Gemmatimonadaceae bacterium]